jgi:3-dehydroquinate synthase
MGHALEKTLGISHGEAVGVGMALAAELSMQKGFISHQEVERIRSLLTRLHLPIAVDFDRQAVIDALGKDKKRESDNIKFVLLKGIGQAVIEDIAIEELKRWIMER